MIQPLRVVHRRAFATLALMLPAIMLIGLGARHSQSSPPARTADVPAAAYVVRESSNLWQRHSIHSKFYSRSDGPQDTYLVLQPAQSLNEPDLLLYWNTNPPQGNVLSGEAQLLGAFSTGKVFHLPLDEKRAGYLVLFSPAHQIVFDTAAVEKLP
jgi:hypothetical protein